MASLRIVFPKPGFFIADTRLQVLLDGRSVYDGSFKSGVDVTVEAEEGAHRLESRIELGPVARTRAWELRLGSAPSVAELRYSRFWGNFGKSLGNG